MPAGFMAHPNLFSVLSETLEVGIFAEFIRDGDDDEN
jgi:hypothetical protein